MSTRFDRTIALIGEDGFAKLQIARVLVVGLGGVGGAAVECLARSGIGSLTLVDGDTFEPTNLNRQILCTRRNIGCGKAAVAKERVLSVNPAANVTAIGEYATAQNISQILSSGYTYCVDAIDDIKNKILLISACKGANIPIVSAMGAGNRTDCDFTVCDVYKTKNDPFARKLRHELKSAGIASLDVVCAQSPPIVHAGKPSSIAAPPLVMGALLANYVINRICA